MPSRWAGAAGVDEESGNRRQLERVARSSSPAQRAGGRGRRLAAGSHNLRSIARILALLEHHNLPRARRSSSDAYGWRRRLEPPAEKPGSASTCLGRDDSGHGLPGPPTAGEHVEGRGSALVFRAARSDAASGVAPSAASATEPAEDGFLHRRRRQGSAARWNPSAMGSRFNERPRLRRPRPARAVRPGRPDRCGPRRPCPGRSIGGGKGRRPGRGGVSPLAPARSV